MHQSEVSFIRSWIYYYYYYLDLCASSFLLAYLAKRQCGMLELAGSTSKDLVVSISSQIHMSI